MATAKRVGMAVGTGVGKLGAYAFKAAGATVVGLGEFGEGVIEGADAGFDAGCKSFDEKAAARKAKAQAAYLAKQAEAAQAQVAAPMAPLAA